MFKNIIIKIFLIILTIMNTSVSAQLVDAVEFKSNLTYVMPHHKKMIHLTQNHFPFFETSLSKNTNIKRYWPSLYNFPIYGITFHYNPFGNNDVLGKAFAVYPYLNSWLIKKDNFQLYFKFGGGLAYLTQKFDNQYNPKNVAISTNLNICVNLGLEAEQKISEKISISEGIAITHYSNGAIKIPNTGINLPSAFVSIKYKMFNYIPINIKEEANTFTKNKFISLYIAGGIKELYPPCGSKFPAFTFSGGYNIQTSPKRIFNVNLDIFYNLANAETLKRKNIAHNNINIIRPGISIGHENVFNKTTFNFAVGRYLYAKDDSDGYIYNRVGFKRYLNKNIFLNLTLKSHLFVADYVEWGAGFKF